VTHSKPDFYTSYMRASRQQTIPKENSSFNPFKQERPTIFGKGSQASLSAGSRAARVKITKKGTSNDLNYCLIVTVYV